MDVRRQDRNSETERMIFRILLIVLACVSVAGTGTSTQIEADRTFVAHAFTPKALANLPPAAREGVEMLRKRIVWLTHNMHDVLCKVSTFMPTFLVRRRASRLIRHLLKKDSFFFSFCFFALYWMAVFGALLTLLCRWKWCRFA